MTKRQWRYWKRPQDGVEYMLKSTAQSFRQEDIGALIVLALREDIGTGDVFGYGLDIGLPQRSNKQHLGGGRGRS